MLVGEVAQSSLTNKRTIIVNNRLERTVLLYLKLLRSNGLRSLVKSCLLLVFMQRVINIGLSVGVDLLLEEGVESVKNGLDQWSLCKLPQKIARTKISAFYRHFNTRTVNRHCRTKIRPGKVCLLHKPKKSRRIRCWASVTVTLTENKTQRMISIVPIDILCFTAYTKKQDILTPALDHRTHKSLLAELEVREVCTFLRQRRLDFYSIYFLSHGFKFTEIRVE